MFLDGEPPPICKSSLLGVQHSREAGRQVPVKPLVNCGHSTSWWEFGPVLTMAQLFFTLFSATGSSFTSDCMHQLFRHVETFFSGADDPFSGLNQTEHVPPSNSFVLWKQYVLDYCLLQTPVLHVWFLKWGFEDYFLFSREVLLSL